MTETTQDLLARLTGFTPGKHISVDQSVYSFHADGPRKGTNRSSAHVNDPHTDPDVLEATAQLYAAAPDLHRLATEQAAEIERLRAAIKRQAGASATLRKLTLDEVQHLRDADRSEYTAAKTVGSEREANAILTDENETLRVEIERLRKSNAMWRANSVDTWSAMTAMRNSINEHIAMPSMENDLSQGPENSIFCAVVAESVVAEIERMRRALRLALPILEAAVSFERAAEEFLTEAEYELNTALGDPAATIFACGNEALTAVRTALEVKP